MLHILYSDKFLPATDFIMWCCLGMMFRLAAWLLSYLFVAKAESKLFIYNELAANIYYVGLSVICYNFWGLNGLGIAFALNYVIYFTQVYLISRFRYSFRFTSAFTREYLIQLTFVATTLAVVLLMHSIYSYVVGGIVLLTSATLSIKGLNKRINMVNVIKSKIK